jgi:virginiamycin B lyase
LLRVRTVICGSPILAPSKVGKITKSGTVTEYSLPSGSNPDRIAGGPDDNRWLTNKGNNKIGKITA